MPSAPADTILNKAAIRWNLSKLTPVAETSRAWTYRVQREDNTSAALRVFKPDHTADADRAGRLLDWYRGDGAIRHYGTSDQCILTEWCEGKLLSEPATDGKDAQATGAIANLIGMLHVARPDKPEKLLPLRDYLTDFHTADVRLWPDTARDLYARSIGIAYAVFDKPSAEIPLHGDVHHDRVMLAERGWVARTPIGLLGDPAWDLAASFLHPWGEVKLGADPVRINAMADAFATKLDLKHKRILAFGAIYAAASACRALAEGQPINWQLAVLPNLLAVYDLA
ncbi:aminoglycoside phosphotransferase family protein [Pelagibacterium limicola]|uniref:aminoglycoside phosphotransferase family protein n=1 Tax=Pelagibacterium limicola TaxID=2791022 RepID=UPI0018AF6B47|nr:aminoglycoside phosphotransferase family protein [Pelagibacterium limicola]